MTKIVIILSKVLVVVFFILMLILDFFPQIGIDAVIPLLGVILFSLLIVIISLKGDIPIFNFKNDKRNLISYIVIGACLLLLIATLTLIGGKSQSDIRLNDPIIWVIYLGSAIYFFKKTKRR